MNGIDLQTQGHKSTAEALAEAHALNVTTSTSHPNPALITAEQAEAMTDDELRRLSRTSLVMMIDRNKGNLSALGAIREALDRIDGKPMQRQTSLVAVANASPEQVFAGWLKEISGNSVLPKHLQDYGKDDNT